MNETNAAPQVKQVEPVAVSQEQQAAIALANLKNLWRCPRWGDAVTLPDCPGIIALAKIACGGERGCRWEGSDDITHKRMAKVAEDIAHKILSACGFMKCFIMEPSKNWLQISGKQTQLHPIFQQAMPIWGGIWFRRIKYCMYPMIDDDLDTLRNWIDAFLPTHAPGFSERLWNPWQNHIKIMKQRWNAPNLLPWPEAFQHFWNLEKSGQYLGMLQTKISQDADRKEEIKGIRYEDLTETDKAIAEAIKKTPGIFGKNIAEIIHKSPSRVRGRLEEGTPLHELGYRQKVGQQGYFPPHKCEEV